MVELDELDIDPDAKQTLKQVAEENDFDISELEIPRKKLEKLFEMFDEDEFRRGIEQAFKQLE